MHRLGKYMLALMLALEVLFECAYLPMNAENPLSRFGPLLAPHTNRLTDISISYGARSSVPTLNPYVRPEFAHEMRTLQPTILAAARRHNHPELSGMNDHDFAVVIATIMYNEHYGWFEERVTPVQVVTPLYEDIQRRVNETGLTNLSVWPANLRPSVGLEILQQQLPLPQSTNMMTVPVEVVGSQIDVHALRSKESLYAAITKEISQPALAVEYLAANLERGQYRAQIEHVPITWRTLAAWHNQGIVSPQDIRANPVASDYLRRSEAYIPLARQLIDTPLIIVKHL